jgi:hypothetical protein
MPGGGRPTPMRMRTDSYQSVIRHAEVASPGILSHSCGFRQALCFTDKEVQMAKYVQFITYKGKRILHTNAAGLEEAEFTVALEEMKQALLKEGSETLAVTDVTGIKLTKAFVNKAKEVTAALEKTPGGEDPVLSWA